MEDIYKKKNTEIKLKTKSLAKSKAYTFIHLVRACLVHFQTFLNALKRL